MFLQALDDELVKIGGVFANAAKVKPESLRLGVVTYKVVQVRVRFDERSSC